MANGKRFATLLLLGLTACNTVAKNPASNSPDKALTQAADSKDSKPAPTRKPASGDPASGQVIDPAFLRSQADYHFSLAEAYALDGDSQKAIEEYKLTLVYDPNSAQIRFKLASELVKKGQLVQAVDQAETAVQIDPKYIDARMLLAGLYTSSKLYDKALEQYYDVCKTDPDNIEAALYIGALLAEEKKYDESAKHFKKVAQNKKYAHLAYYYLGRIELERHHDKDAEQAFLKALTAKPDFIETTVALGYLYEEQQKTESAIKVYRTYQEKYGPSSKIASSLGRIYMDKDEYDLAYKQFEIIANQESDNLNVRVKMALILIEQKKFKEAVASLKEILTIAPDSEKIHFYLAGSL